ncbi:3-oxoacyl-[acyl-carrier-protein] synthase III C-terminal domain-containing protein [Paenibacillus illinoisensis]|uniref:3-oxoacyl-[acyl-carrier-protein] synthase III C-terminal domain-containing protein n=1 Tax=Paenibacillus illinoisensis TaxID=59845 RepID=UPI00301D765F
MGFGIMDIGVYLPEQIQEPEEVLADLELGKGELQFLRKCHRLEGVPVADTTQLLDDTIALAVEPLEARHSFAEIDLVLYAHSFQVQVPGDYRLLQRILSRFGLEDVPFYGITQMNCASSIAALQWLERIYQTQPHIRNVLLVCADQFNFLPPEWRYLRKSAILGDSAVAVLLTRDHCQHVVQSAHILRNTRFHTGYHASPKEITAFNQLYVDHIIQGMEELLSSHGLNFEDVDHIFPHNVNWTTWKEFSRRTGVGMERIYLDNIQRIGHTFSTDPFINLYSGLEQDWLRKQGRSVMVSIGLGSFFGFAMLEHGGL